MNVEAFLDSNIPLYAASKDPDDRAKAERAAELMLGTRFGISMQVAQEFYHNARIKARVAVPAEQAETIMRLLLDRPCAITDEALFAEARRLCERYQLRYWDSAIVAAARRLSAPILYSEDLTHGQDFEGVRVVNPFL